MERPRWELLTAPLCCDECGKAYAENEFETRLVERDEILLQREFRTWCKDCEAHLLEEGEET